MVLQNYQNFIELTSNKIYFAALGVGLKCPLKIHLNTQWRGPKSPTMWLHNILMVPGASDGQALRGVVMNITVLRWIRRACNMKYVNINENQITFFGAYIHKWKSNSILFSRVRYKLCDYIDFFDEKCIYVNRIFQNITFICFHEDEKNWNNTVILDQLVFYSSRVQCSNSIQFYGSCTVVKLIYGAETHSPKFPMSLAREPQYSPLKNVSSGHLLRTLGHTLNVMTVSGTKIVKTNRSHWLLIKYYIAERREKKHQNTSST